MGCPVVLWGGLKVLCLSNSKELSHNQTVLMTSHYFNFDAVTHSIKDVFQFRHVNRVLLPN